MLINSDVKSIICGSCEDDAKKIFKEADINVIENAAGGFKTFLKKTLKNQQIPAN